MRRRSHPIAGGFLLFRDFNGFVSRRRLYPAAFFIFMIMDYFKADYTTGRIVPVKAKEHRDGMVLIGNTRYEKAEDIMNDYASYHTNYFRAKDALLENMQKRRDNLLEEAQKLIDMIDFARRNY